MSNQQLTLNFDLIQKLIQKLRPALTKHAALTDVETVNAREAELVARLNELVAEGENEGTLLVDTARELQNIRANKAKQEEKLAEVRTTISKLKYLLVSELVELNIDEQPATAEEFGL